MEKDHKNSFKLILSLQYFLYFGVMGIFLPYFNLYCYHLDFTGFQIGVLSAARSVVLVLAPPLWGILADRNKIRRPIYILCNLISTAIWIFFFFTTDFFTILVVFIFYSIFYAPVISFLEAFTIDVLGREKKSYGRIRAWGSIAFIIVVICIGRIIDIYSIQIIIVLIFTGSVLLSIFSLKIPLLTCEREKAGIHKAKTLLNNKVIFFLICAFLMLVSHGTYYGFFSIHLENLGYDKTFIGMAWAMASISEIVTMLNSDRIFKRFSMETVLVFSFFVATIRWFILFMTTLGPFILFLQILHAVTYGAFHVASILYIDSLIPDDAKTLGQAVNNAVTYGLGLMVGFFISGYLFEKIGVQSLFMMSAVIALFAGILFKGSLIYRVAQSSK